MKFPNASLRGRLILILLSKTHYQKLLVSGRYLVKNTFPNFFGGEGKNNYFRGHTLPPYTPLCRGMVRIIKCS